MLAEQQPCWESNITGELCDVLHVESELSIFFIFNVATPWDLSVGQKQWLIFTSLKFFLILSCHSQKLSGELHVIEMKVVQNYVAEKKKFFFFVNKNVKNEPLVMFWGSLLTHMQNQSVDTGMKIQ